MSLQIQNLSYAVVTVSDSASEGRAVDTSGPALVELVKKTLKTQNVQQYLVSDDYPRIVRQLQQLVDQGVALILTTGGTGFGLRDVTPEATKEVIKRKTPGLNVAITCAGLQITPLAALSRAVSGIIDQTLIVNLPGSRKGAEEGFLAIAQVLPHGLQVLREQVEDVQRVHKQLGDNRTTLGQRGQQAGQLGDRQQIGGQQMAKSKVRIDQVALRSRESLFPLIEVQDASELIRKSIQQSNIKGQVETILLEQALQRVLAEDITAIIDQPPFRASIKDGYAVRSLDGKGKRVVIEGIIAGDAVICKLDYELQQGQCLRINTGAVVPRSADAVVQVEDTKLVKAATDGSRELEIDILVLPKKGQDIRNIGSDIRKGSLVLAAGTLLGAAELGLLASVGTINVTVYSIPKVGVLSTGNELQTIGNVLQDGHIYDSNKLLLLSLLKEQQIKGIDLGIATDNPNETLYKLQQAFDKVDILITTGSVSMGERDILKQVLQQDLDADIKFGRLNLKPGKPTTFATLIWNGKQKLVFALPGNPVSTFVTYQILLQPALKQIIGHSIIRQPLLTVLLGEDLILDQRPEYVRAALTIDQQLGLIAYKTGDQISSRLASIPQASALLVLPGRTETKIQLRKGEKVQVILLRADLIGQQI